MANGAETVDLLSLSKSKLRDLLSKIEKQKGQASAEAQRIRGLIKQVSPRTRERIQRRRFGFPVQKVKEAQRQTIQRRGEARTFIKEGRGAIGKLDESQRQLQQEQDLVRDVRKARKIFESTDPRAIFGLKTKRQQRFFRALKSKKRSIGQRAEIKKLEKTGVIEKKGKEFIFTEEGIKKIQAGDVDFSKFKFIQPPEIVQITTVSPGTFSVKATDVEKKPAKKSVIKKAKDVFVKINPVLFKGVPKVTRTVIPKDFATGVGEGLTFVLQFPDGRTKSPVVPDPAIAEFAGGVVTGAITEVRERPLKLIAFFGVGSVVGVGLRGVGALGVRGGALVGGTRGAKIARRVTTGVGIGVAGLGATIIGVSVTKEIQMASTATGKGIVTGRTITEFASFGLGAKVGSKAGEALIGRLRTRGTKEIPGATIKDPAVTAGTKTFPEINPKESAKQLRSRFFEPKLPSELTRKPRSFTTTDLESRDLVKTATIGQPRGKTIKSEFPGQFGADVISPHFLRILGSSSSGTRPSGFKNFLKSFDIAPSEPTIIRSTLKSIKIPKSVGTTPGRSKALKRELSGLLGGKKGDPIEKIIASKPLLKPGQSVIPFMKAERELIIVKGTKFDITGKKFFVKVDGIRVPIIERTAKSSKLIDSEFRLLGKPSKKPIATKIKEIGISVSESGGGGSSISARASKPLISMKSLSSPRTSRSASRSSLTSSRGSSSVARSVRSSLKLGSSPRLPRSSRTPKTSRRITTSLISPPLSSPRVSRAVRSPSSTLTSSLRLPTVSKDPTTRRILPPKFRLSGRKKATKSKPRFRDDLALVPDISARVAGITVTIPKSKLRGIASKSVSGLGIRAIPLIK